MNRSFSIAAMCGSLVSLSTYKWKRSPNPDLSMPASMAEVANYPIR